MSAISALCNIISQRLGDISAMMCLELYVGLGPIPAESSASGDVLVAELP